MKVAIRNKISVVKEIVLGSFLNKIIITIRICIERMRTLRQINELNKMTYEGE